MVARWLVTAASGQRAAAAPYAPQSPLPPNPSSDLHPTPSCPAPTSNSRPWLRFDMRAASVIQESHMGTSGVIALLL